MKKFFSSLTMICAALFAAQTITIGTYLTANPTQTLTLIGSDGGNPARNIYGATFPIFCCNGVGEIRVQWNSVNSQWQIENSYCNGGNVVSVVNLNGFPSSPNPPDLLTGIWFDIGGCGLPDVFSGTGTQSGTLATSALQSNRSKIQVFPNPSNNFITVQNKERSAADFGYKIIDVTGKLVEKGKSRLNDKINISHLQVGSYIIQVETEKGDKISEQLLKK